MDIDKLQRTIDNIFHLNMQSYENWQINRKMIFIRNVFVHNNGIVNDIFLKNINEIQYKQSEEITLLFKEFEEIYHAVHGFIGFLYDKIVQKWKLKKNPIFWDKNDIEMFNLKKEQRSA